MNAAHAIPNTIDEITPLWLSEALQTSTHGVEIVAAETSPIGTGQMATSIRAELRYADDATEAPTSVVVKIASDDPRSRAAGERGAYLREIRYYELLDDLVDVNTPQCFWSRIDLDSNSFALVLEDMRPAQQGDQIVGCTVEQAVAAAKNIAGLHAPVWRDDTLYEHEWLTPSRDQRAAQNADVPALLTPLTEGFIERYAADIDKPTEQLLHRFAAGVVAWLDEGMENFSLTHADHRLDNLLFADRAERAVTVVDWQTVGVRNPLADVAYLLGTGMDPAARREAEHDVLASYYACLIAGGVSNYTSEQCFADYRAQSLHALLITVLGSMMTVRTDRGDEMFMAMLHRSTQQIFDLESTEFL